MPSLRRHLSFLLCLGRRLLGRGAAAVGGQPQPILPRQRALEADAEQIFAEEERDDVVLAPLVDGDARVAVAKDREEGGAVERRVLGDREEEGVVRRVDEGWLLFEMLGTATSVVLGIFLVPTWFFFLGVGLGRVASIEDLNRDFQDAVTRVGV